jgi:hypothetical protein
MVLAKGIYKGWFYGLCISWSNVGSKETRRIWVVAYKMSHANMHTITQMRNDNIIVK